MLIVRRDFISFIFNAEFMQDAHEYVLALWLLRLMGGLAGLAHFMLAGSHFYTPLLMQRATSIVVAFLACILVQTFILFNDHEHVSVCADTLHVLCRWR